MSQPLKQYNQIQLSKKFKPVAAFRQAISSENSLVLKRKVGLPGKSNWYNKHESVEI